MKVGEYLFKKKGLEPEDFIGIYKEIAEVIGVEATVLLHDNFGGQQFNLPKKLYTKDYMIRQVNNENGRNKIRMLAREYGYTERRIRQIIKEAEK